MNAETLQRLRDLAASPEMMPNMLTLRRDLAELLAAYDAVSSATMHGTLVRCGTMTVSDEEVTGYVIACERKQIEQLKRLPMYSEFSLVPKPQ